MEFKHRGLVRNIPAVKHVEGAILLKLGKVGVLGRSSVGDPSKDGPFVIYGDGGDLEGWVVRLGLRDVWDRGAHTLSSVGRTQCGITAISTTASAHMAFR